MNRAGADAAGNTVIESERSVIFGYMHDSIPVCTVVGALGRDAAAALEQRIAQAAGSGHRRIVIDLLGAAPLALEAQSALCAALNGASKSIELAVIGADERLTWVFDRCGISVAHYATVAGLSPT